MFLRKFLATKVLNLLMYTLSKQMEQEFGRRRVDQETLEYVGGDVVFSGGVKIREGKH